MGARLRHHRHHGGGIHPAREERAERHIRHHARADGGADVVEQLLLLRRHAAACAIGEADVPILRGAAERLAAPHRQPVAGGQLRHARDDAGVVGHVAEREIIVDGGEVGRATQQRVGEQALEFGGEDQAAVGQFRHVQRLHPEAVAHQEQGAFCCIVDGEGEHAVEARQHRRPPLPPAAQDHLGIAMRGEDVAERFQLGADLGEIVDLAVEGDDVAAVLRRHRLRAAGHVDDGEAAVAEADAGGRPHPLPIRAAMGLRVRHRADALRIDRLGGVDVEDAGDAAHISLPPCDRRGDRAGRARGGRRRSPGGRWHPAPAVRR